MMKQLLVFSFELLGKCNAPTLLKAKSLKLEAGSRGFSLTELVVVIAISVVVMLGVYEIYITFGNSYLYQNAQINNASGAALFMNEFSDLSLQADAIVSSRTVSGTIYTTSSTTLIYEIPTVNSSGNVINATYDYAILYASSTNAYRILDANGSSARRSGTKRLSDSVSNLTFTYNNVATTSSTAVTADITTKTTIKSESFTTHLKQQVYLRNKSE
jgi:prepilin-type N-terminal cleavage/methylation domain-containing protein